MRAAQVTERATAGGKFKQTQSRARLNGREEKGTLIFFPRAKPARFCRRASNCSVTGQTIGHEPLTPLTPPQSCPSCCYFGQDPICPCTTTTQISCERDLPPASSPIPLSTSTERRRKKWTACSALPEKSRPGKHSCSVQIAPDKNSQCTHSA